MSVRSPGSIDWPDNPTDGQEYSEGEFTFVYNAAKNKWTIKSKPSITSIENLSVSSPIGIDFVNLEDEYSSEAGFIFRDTAISNDPLRSLKGWRKITFPKSLTDGSDVIYIRAQLFANGYTQSGTDIYSPLLQTWITGYEPDGTNVTNSTKKPLLKFWTAAAHESTFGVPSVPQSPYTDSLSYAFLKVFEDPDNSDNFAFWHDLYRNSAEGRIYYAIAGYLKAPSEITVSLDAEVLTTGTRGEAGVTTGPNPPANAAAGDIWYEENEDGTYTPKIYNAETGEFEESPLGGDQINPGQRGEVFYYTTDGTNEHISQTIADVGRYVKQDDVLESTTAGARAEEIFNNWYRFSHNSTNTYPAREGDLNAWDYDENTGIIECTANTGTYVGFVSDDVATDYTHKVTLSSAGSDNDTVAVIIGYITEGLPGQANYREYTLSAITNTGGTAPRSGWGIYYNYLQSDQQEIASIDISPSGGWSGKTLRVEIEKTGSAISAVVSDFNSGTVNEDYRISFNCNDSEFLTKFAGDVKYGYAAYSQDRATFYDAVLTGFAPSTVYDMDNGVGYVYNSSSGNFETESNSFDQLKLNNPGRFLIDQETKKLYYVDQSANVYPITATDPNVAAKSRSYLQWGFDSAISNETNLRDALTVNGATNTGIRMPREGAISGLSFNCSVTSHTSNTSLTVVVQINGVDALELTGSSVSAITGQYSGYVQATESGEIPYAAGSHIRVRFKHEASGIITDDHNFLVEITTTT